MLNIFAKRKTILLLLIVGMVGCASTRTQESTGEYLENSAITAKVKSALLADKEVSALHINVETFKGTVQLSGFANSKQEADKAVVLAQNVKDVKSVKNDIRIK